MSAGIQPDRRTERKTDVRSVHSGGLEEDQRSDLVLLLAYRGPVVAKAATGLQLENTAGGVKMQGSEMKAIRKEWGLTQDELAAAIGMNRVTVGLMERGEAPIERRTQLAIEALDQFAVIGPPIVRDHWALIHRFRIENAHHTQLVSIHSSEEEANAARAQLRLNHILGIMDKATDAKKAPQP